MKFYLYLYLNFDYLYLYLYLSFDYLYLYLYLCFYLHLARRAVLTLDIARGGCDQIDTSSQVAGPGSCEPGSLVELITSPRAGEVC